jgi:type 1 glutamine amidotransferase
MMRTLLCLTVLGFASLVGLVAEEDPKPKLLPPRQPHIVFVTGDCEYRSEVSMPMIAQILGKRHGVRCTVCYPLDEKGELKPKFLKNIKGLDTLKDADLVVFYIRYRQLPDDQLKLILDYIGSGKPIVGLRTSTHGFRYGEAPNNKWNDGFGRDVFGQKWISHHGHKSSTRVTVTAKDHAIVRGLPAEFHCRSWLYNVAPLVGECTPLMDGEALQTEDPASKVFGTKHPVAWTKTYGKARVFFTTLGHPKDFENEAARKLLINGIFWAMGWEERIPEKGCAAETVEKYVAPPTTWAVPDPTVPAATLTRYALPEEGNPFPIGR